VARLEPFAGIRYAPATPLDRVTAPPYDVLTADDRAELAARDPHNVVVIDLPRDASGAPDYAGAGATFRRWRQDGVLVNDERPSFTIYRLTATDAHGRRRTSSGVLGALEVADPGGDVLPHEETTPKDRTDRWELTRATDANLSPIWGLSMGTGLGALLAEPGEALGSFVDGDGVEHTVERVDDPARLAAITAAVATAPVVIADGHHRYEIARLVRDERAGPGPHDLTLAFVVELAEEQLTVHGIHRLLDGLPAGRSWADVLEPWFELEPAGPVGPPTLAEMERIGALCLVEPDGSGSFLLPRSGRFTGVPALDSARLAHALAGEAPAPGASEVMVRYQHGLDNVLGALGARRAQAGVLLRPVTVTDIKEFAARRELMPPKSTFFWPKLRTGLVFRSLAPE
jgi:uncharacterized protein (DUF1015 family)